MAPAHLAIVALLLTASAAPRAWPQAKARTPLTLEAAIDFALAHHPALRVQRAGERAAEADVAAAEAGILPRVDLSGQLNRATGNVLPGSLFAMPNIPSVSGPAGTHDFDSGTFGSLFGVSAALDVAGLKRRMTLVDAALEERNRARAGTDARKLAVAFGAADAFVALVTQQEVVKATRASVERARTLATQLGTLAQSELRPAADAARAKAEQALAQTQLVRAQQVEAVRRALFAQALGAAGEAFDAIAGPLTSKTSRAEVSSGARNPLLVEAEAARAAALARSRATDLEYWPRVDVAAALWVRGSGYARANSIAAPADGLVPNTGNWAAGIVVSWPVLETFAVKARAAAAAANVEAAAARQDEIAQAVESQIDTARAALDGARAVAEQTQPALASARAAEEQARARFDAGLGAEIEVADAQRLLAQAELEDVSARLGVWSGMLLLSRALGDLTPFLTELRAAAGGR